MIKINKDLTDIPDSLKLPFKDLFTGKIPSPPKTTHTRRMEIINANNYIDTAVYNARYKQNDVKDSLITIYKNKCAYCEQRIEQSHVEHYRPKTVYYWIAFSWDNLILACPTCNQHKGTNFNINGTAATFINNASNIRNIHNTSSSYDILEQPEMVNPEITDPLGNIQFDLHGIISSNDSRFKYTIEKCKIDRADLNDQRRTIINTFKEDIRSALLENKLVSEQEVAIKTIVSKFVRDSNNEYSAFIAFKRYSLSSSWLQQIIKEMN